MGVERIDLHANQLFRKLTLTVSLRGMRVAMWRMRLGVWIVGMGIRITGMRGGVDLGDADCNGEGGPRGYAGGGASPPLLYTDAPPPPPK